VGKDQSVVLVMVNEPHDFALFLFDAWITGVRLDVLLDIVYGRPFEFG
jgi:hypothetical protein